MLRRFAIAVSTIAASALLLQGHNSSAAQATTQINNAKNVRGPQIYKSPESGTLFYVESDGRHVSAIDPNGKLLWCRDPFVETGMKPYRVKEPRIVRIGPPVEWMNKAMSAKGKKGELILINYNSSQAGVLEAATGDFTFMGQD